MIIQHNIPALNSYRQLNGNNNALAKNLEKLSSGYKINRAGDDAAGLAISEKMRAQITGLKTAQQNAKDGNSLIQTAEGALTEVHSMLNRMVELATKSSNGVYGATERQKLVDEVNNLKDEIDRISDATNFNGINLLDGTMGGYETTQTNAYVVSGVSGIDISGGNIPNGASIEVTIDAVGKVTVTPDDGVNGALPDGLEFYVIGEDGNEYGLIEDNGQAGLDAAMTVDTSKGGTIQLAVRVQPSATTATEPSKEAWDQWGNVKVNIAIGAASDKTQNPPQYSTAEQAGTKLTISPMGKGLTLQVGDTNADYQKVTLNVGRMSSEGLGISGVDVSTQDSAGASIDVIKAAIERVSATRGNLGAMQNRLDHTINNLSVTTENLTAAESRIRDTDMAEEMTSYTKNNILVQAAQAMLAQANQVPQGVLQLLQ